MIAQVVDEPRFHLNADAVAVTGASYGGGHSWLAALEPTFASPRDNAVRIRTVVPIAAWATCCTDSFRMGASANRSTIRAARS